MNSVHLFRHQTRTVLKKLNTEWLEKKIQICCMKKTWRDNKILNPAGTRIEWDNVELSKESNYKKKKIFNGGMFWSTYTINDFTEKKILWKDLEVSLQILGFSTASESSFEKILVFSSGVRPKPLFWFRSWFWSGTETEIGQYFQPKP